MLQLFCTVFGNTVGLRWENGPLIPLLKFGVILPLEITGFTYVSGY